MGINLTPPFLKGGKGGFPVKKKPPDSSGGFGVSNSGEKRLSLIHIFALNIQEAQRQVADRRQVFDKVVYQAKFIQLCGVLQAGEVADYFKSIRTIWISN